MNEDTPSEHPDVYDGIALKRSCAEKSSRREQNRDAELLKLHAKIELSQTP